MQISVRVKGVNITLSYENHGNGQRQFFVNGVRKDGVWNDRLGVCALTLRENELCGEDMRIEIVD